MSSKVSSSVKTTPPSTTTNTAKRLTKLTKKGKGRVKREEVREDEDVYRAIPSHHGGSGTFPEDEEVIVHVVPPSSPVPPEESLSDPDQEVEFEGSVVDPETGISFVHTQVVVNRNQESDQFLEDEDEIESSEDCEEEEEEDVSSEECIGEEEEEDCVTDEISEEEEEEGCSSNSPQKTLPHHRPQLPLAERAPSNVKKRRGRTGGGGSALSIPTAASAIKRARGVGGIRGSKGSSIGTGGGIGKSKSLVSSLRKNRRLFTTNTNPIFLHNSSSDEEEEEEEEEDLGEEYLEGDESEEEEDEDGMEPPEFLLSADGDPSALQNIPPDAQARLEAFFEAAGFTDGKLMSDPESLRKLTLTVSSALGEASAAINRMRDSQRKSIEEGRSDSLEEGDSLLALACSSGYFELARVLLAMGANVDDRGSKGDLTPLMDASSQGHLEIVRLLISHNADVNAQSACGNSALMYACASGHVTVVEELLKVGAHVEDNNENGHTPLMEAASAGHVPVAKLLLSHGAGINTHSNEFKESALTVACYKGHLDMVRFLLEAGADQQHKTDEMHTALMEASMDGHVEVARLLLDSGAQVNMPADSFESPLTLAACGGHVELAQLLLERGANIEEVNDEGYTPLMEAAREGHLCVVKTLLKHHALVNAKTEETQETGLTLAACGGFLDVVDLLVKAGADIELGASTPLMEASQEGHLQVVRYLIEKGADIFRQGASQDIALSFAAENGHLEVVQLLVDMGSNPEHLSEGGRTPLMKAARGGHIDVIKYLLGKKADVNRQTTTNDHTPLSLACAGGHLPAVELLLAVGANPYHKLKDNSTMIIEAARGGHTPVIRCLLDYLPPNIKAPGPKAQGGKQAQTISKAATPSHTLKSQDPKVLHQSKPITSVLRKCRSTSTLDSTPLPGKDCSDGGNREGEGECATKGYPPNEPSKGMRGGSCEVIPRPLPPPTTTSEGKEEMEIIRGPASVKKVGGFCSDCSKSPSDSIQPLPPGHSQVKRPAAPDQQQQTPSSLNPPILPPTSPSVSTTGPPLVPSQVTAATAISERPKAKAKAPRKTCQLQNQGQVSGLAGSSGTSSTGTSPGSDKGQLVSPGGSPPTHTAPPPVPIGITNVPSTPTGMLVEMEVAGVVGSSGNPMDLKDIKLDTKQLSQIFAQHQQQFLKKGGGILQGQGSLDQAYVSGGPGSTTTTTTTVVVTHGNGETETIFDGENLPPGANQVIMNAAAAAFPLDCFSLPSGLQMSPSAEVHVQSYQVGDGSPLTTTTMQTTTIINASPSALNNFQQQLILPHHPPPLPAAIAAAAAAAGLVPPSGAPPPAPTKAIPKKELQAQKNMNSSLMTPKVSGTSAPPGQPPIPVNQVPPVSSLAAPFGQKKQLAKRSRQVAQQGGSCSRQSNQQTQTHAHAHTHAGTKQNQAVASTQTTITGQQVPGSHFDVNTATESSGETSLSIAAASGHYEVVEFLLGRKAHIEHKDKKGCTPLILAADGGYDKVVELLLSRGAEIEAQSERTKDTALSLACTKGRFEVVDLLLKKGANKEHRNVSDYTPLSLAASGGYVNIIKLLLQNGAEINSRTGSKLGISPLMLAAMNGNTAAVKLLLDMGSDINAQIETNKNTALTLACFQGRQEVVSLLLDRKANLEHRAKTGLTPLMEAANGGYTEVGKILIDKGADVNAAPVPATKDTALTIAADKGHYRFVELLLSKHALVEVRNKKGCTPAWLASNGGHLDVAQILYKHRADMDAQDNRKVSCLMAAFRKGHVKVIRWIVKNVQQFPSDAEMLRYYASIQGETDLLKKSQQCGEFIKQAKDKQALEANKNASILLEELDQERSREESKRQAAARRREKKKKKKQEKRQGPGEEEEEEEEEEEDEEALTTIDSGIDANSLASNSSANGRSNKENEKGEKTEDHEEPKLSAKSRKRKNRKDRERLNQLNSHPVPVGLSHSSLPTLPTPKDILKEKENKMGGIQTPPQPQPPKTTTTPLLKPKDRKTKRDSLPEPKIEEPIISSKTQHPGGVAGTSKKGNRGPDGVKEPIVSQSFESSVSSSCRKTGGNSDSPDTLIFSPYTYIQPHYFKNTTSSSGGGSGNGKGGRKDDGWKEVTRSFPSSRSKKVIVPSSVISRVIGRGGCNINAIREATGAHIEVEKQQKGQIQPERTIQIKGTGESTKQAHTLITALMNEPDLDVKKLLPLSSTLGASGLSQFTTGIFSSPLSSVTTVSNRQSTTSSSPTTVDNNSFTTYLPNSCITPLGGKANGLKSNRRAPSPTVPSQVSPPVQKPMTPVNGNSTSSFKAVPPTTVVKKPTLYTNSGKGVNHSSVSSSMVNNSFSNKCPHQNNSGYQGPGSGTSIGGISSGTFSGGTPNVSTPISSPVPSLSPSLGSMNGDSIKSPSVGGTPARPSTQVFSNTLTTNFHQTQKEPLINPQIQNTNKIYPQPPVSRTSPVQMTRNSGLGISLSVIGPPGTVRSPSAPDTSESVGDSSEPQPLEYSPFNYTFSKTAGWFPGDLAQVSSVSRGKGFNNSHTVASPHGHIGSPLNLNQPINSSVARAMNFASVAASGISTSSMSTTTAQISQVGNLQNGGVVGSLGSGIATFVPMGGKGIGDNCLESDVPKVDASKAPGYRGNSMGSPVLRIGSIQPPQNSIPLDSSHSSQFGGIQSGNGILNMGSGQNLMGFSGSGRNGGSMNMGGLGGHSVSQNFGQDLGTQGNNNNSFLYGNNSGGLPPTGAISSSHAVVSSSTVPTNVIMSSRLNPRAPSFTLPQHSKLGQSGQPQPSVSNFQQQLPPFHTQHHHHLQSSFKLSGFGTRTNNMIPSGRQGVGSGMNLSSSWNPYANDVVDLQNLAALASATGTLDPQVLFPGLDPIVHDNQNSTKGEGRLPRPIGGERAWKNSGSNSGVGNMSNMTPFTTMDCMDTNSLPQPITIQSSPQQSIPSQGQGWLGSMYGPPPPQQFPQGSNQQVNTGSGIHGNHGRNFLGRRFMDDMDPNRIIELQQMIDGQHRLMNGGLGPPPIHMQPPIIYPFGPPEHMDPHIPPKVDQHNSWDNHVHNLEEKHTMGWGGKWGN